ncbi:MAG TPA: hypothetical protein VI874_04130 [Candidatus Norongarragalinales archaeon]|nr:hypothetical protein [Candidatus Norongarragalinales archaeon]
MMNPKKYSVYKPNKRLAGAAFQFDCNPAKESVFVEGANQIGEQMFDWSNKVVVKLSAADIAKLLTVLENKKPSIELFHDSTKTSKPFTESYSQPAPLQKPATTAAANPAAASLSVANPAPTLKSTTVSLSKGEYGFFIKATRQYSDGKVASVNMPLSDDEALSLRLLLSAAIVRIYGW